MKQTVGAKELAATRSAPFRRSAMSQAEGGAREQLAPANLAQALHAPTGQRVQTTHPFAGQNHRWDGARHQLRERKAAQVCLASARARVAPAIHSHGGQLTQARMGERNGSKLEGRTMKRQGENAVAKVKKGGREEDGAAGWDGRVRVRGLQQGSREGCACSELQGGSVSIMDAQ